MTERDIDTALGVAANQLFASVTRSVAGRAYVPAFCRQKLEWLVTEQKAARLRFTLLKNPSSARLDFEDLMASGRVDGKPVIVIAQPRFMSFLVEGGRIAAPFSRQQENDFMLGLVHEAVHLQNPNLERLASLDDRIREELRAWREVDLHAVRQLRALNEPLHSRFIEADDALRSCGDLDQCDPLKKLLLPNEARRQATLVGHPSD